MEFTNIKPDEQIKLPKSIKLDTNRPSPRYNTEYEIIDAYEYAKSLINLKPRAGWELEL